MYGYTVWFHPGKKEPNQKRILRWSPWFPLGPTLPVHKKLEVPLNDECHSVYMQTLYNLVLGRSKIGSEWESCLTFCPESESKGAVSRLDHWLWPLIALLSKLNWALLPSTGISMSPDNYITCYARCSKYLASTVRRLKHENIFCYSKYKQKTPAIITPQHSLCNLLRKNFSAHFLLSPALTFTSTALSY